MILSMLKKGLKTFSLQVVHNEANEAIKEILEKNGSSQEEVRMLRREQEI